MVRPQGEVAPMNEPLIEMLSCVTDCRRGQAKRYRLANILMFCILGFLCGAKSYKTLCSFIEERFALLRAAFPSSMKRAPAPSTLWRIIGLVDGASLEAVFRRHAGTQHAALGGGPGALVPGGASPACPPRGASKRCSADMLGHSMPRLAAARARWSRMTAR